MLSTNGLQSLGGSETYALTVAEHMQRLGHDVTVHANEVAPAIINDRPGLRFAVREEGLPRSCDGVIVQDAICSHMLAARYPEAPQVFVAHSTVHDVQLPPQLSDLCPVVVALNERTAARVRALAVPTKIVRLRQPIDLDVFAPLVGPRPRAQTVLALGNHLPEQRREMLRQACEEAGLELMTFGLGVRPTDRPAERMVAADIVVGYGRCILEAMACGRAAYVWDHLGGDGWVTPKSYSRLEADGFGGRATPDVIDAARLRDDLAAYDQRMGIANRDLAVANHGPRTHAQALVAELREAGAQAPEPRTAHGELARVTRIAWEAEGKAFELSRRLESAEAALESERAQAAELRHALGRAYADADAFRATRRYRLALALARPLDRVRARRLRAGGASEAEISGSTGSVRRAPGGSPELAVVVFSYRAQPELARAVRSVLDQNEPLEVVVVNSGGGDAEALLASAGLDTRVQLFQTPERLFPGGACNVGLRATTAPYVAFMAGDVVAEPGWVAGRLRRHRAGIAAVAGAIVPVRPTGAAGRASYLLLHHRRTPWTPAGKALRFSLSYDRSLFERYGTFREDLRVGEDSELQARFGNEVAIQFAPDVRGAHHYPRSAPALLRDQFARGRRMAYSHAWLQGDDGRALIARSALRNAPEAARAGWRGGAGIRGRVELLSSARLMAPGAAAYALGALTTPLDGPRPSARAAARRMRRPRRRRRLIALLPFKDEMRYLPGLFENLRPHVDGIVALDDGSSDNSRDFVAVQPEVLEILGRQHGDDRWRDAYNHQRLVRAAWEHDPDWLLGIDADERVERNFRKRAERVFDAADRDADSAFSLHFRELWDRPDRFRVDGVWGRKRKAVLFRARRDHRFHDEHEFHTHWAPLNDYPDQLFPKADLFIYHLRMLREEDRRERRARYERLDPHNRSQSIGYEYLTATEHLLLAPPPHGRDFVPDISFGAPRAAPPPARAPELPRRRPRSRPRIRNRLIALLPFKDEMRYLPTLFENLDPHVDGIVALDDGSTDGSREFVAKQPKLLELLSREHTDDLFHEAEDHERLVRAAWRFEADWLFGIDADERVERHFRERAEREFARADAEGHGAYFVYVRSLWDRPDLIRIDGPTGRARKPVLFRSRTDHQFDLRPLHNHWAPLNDHPNHVFPQANLILYHLRTLNAEDRAARHARYLRIDPVGRFQPAGYDHMIDTRALQLVPPPPGRDFVPLPGEHASAPPAGKFRPLSTEVTTDSPGAATSPAQRSAQ